jgi:hypothetical protein
MDTGEIYLIEVFRPCHTCNGSGEICDQIFSDLEEIGSNPDCPGCDHLQPCPICLGSGMTEIKYSRDIPAISH